MTKGSISGAGAGVSGKKARPASLKESYLKALRGFGKMVPFLCGVILLVGLIRTYLTKDIIAHVFTGAALRDTLIGDLLGSVSAGNPITSYIIGGELLKNGVSLYAAAAFIVAWVTVGVVQFPAEAGAFGARFAALRNLLSFALALLIALFAVSILIVVV